MPRGMNSWTATALAAGLLAGCQSDARRTPYADNPLLLSRPPLLLAPGRIGPALPRPPRPALPTVVGGRLLRRQGAPGKRPAARRVPRRRHRPGRGRADP